MYSVVCMKWGDKYGAEYVNRLYNMVARNTTLPFKFVCFTDNANGLLPEIESRPLPDHATLQSMHEIHMHPTPWLIRSIFH